MKMKLNVYFVLKIALVLFCALGVGDCGIMTDYFRRLNKERIELLSSLQNCSVNCNLNQPLVGAATHTTLAKCCPTSLV